MVSFYDFFKLGISNIAYFNVFGHILFIIALCGIYTFGSWPKVLIYIITFLVGYLITFLLETFNYISLPEDMVINFLIPLTIIFIAISNFFLKRQAFTNKYPEQNYKYIVSFAAGLVHGCAFPESLQSYLLGTTSVAAYLIAFILGIVTGLVLIAFFLLCISFFLSYFMRMNMREWNLMLSGACAGIAIYIIANSILF